MTREPRPPIVTIGDGLRYGRSRLSGTATESPGLDAEVLLRHVLGLDRTHLFAQLSEPLAPKALVRYERLLEERANRVPVAYLTGEREFMGLPFAVGPGVLVPRPETEILVEWATEWLRHRPTATVVDVGTGSGAIALSIAQILGNDWRGHVVCADVSGAALEIAARNRSRFGLARQVALVQGSLLAWLGGPVDLVLANLPYLRPEQIEENPDLGAEPRLALDGGRDGLAAIRQLIVDVARVLAPGGAIGIEIDPSQRGDVIQLAGDAFPDANIAVLRDLAGLDRHVVITFR
jgi:release factor glutamine methyltransferase